jgi:hypothetical protein
METTMTRTIKFNGKTITCSNDAPCRSGRCVGTENLWETYGTDTDGNEYQIFLASKFGWNENYMRRSEILRLGGRAPTSPLHDEFLWLERKLTDKSNACDWDNVTVEALANDDCGC